MDEAVQRIKEHKKYIAEVRENKVNTETDAFRKTLKEIEKFLVEPFIKDEAEIFQIMRSYKETLIQPDLVVETVIMKE